MTKSEVKNYIKDVLKNMPAGWLSKTTHRLDVYNESLAKVQFLEEFEKLVQNKRANGEFLNELPTAFDYIRLGHPLSCLLEWSVAKSNNLSSSSVISFSSKVMPVLAVLRKNLLSKKDTKIIYKGELPKIFDSTILKDVYNYKFSLEKINDLNKVSDFNGSLIYILDEQDIYELNLKEVVDFFVTSTDFGSVLVVNGEKNEGYISDVQHVRRRETIAMTPVSCLNFLKAVLLGDSFESESGFKEKNKDLVVKSIQSVTGSDTRVLLGSSGLSVQYAILMGLIQSAKEGHKGKSIKIIVPPNCYGGTNDQARRIASCIENVEVMDMPVDGGNDMAKSVDVILEKISKDDGVPFIIAEIPTNPRVEVPDLLKLEKALSKERKTKNGEVSVSPVFILDQTFCPNVHFLGESEILSNVQTISYVSGSKFPSGGLCTAGYCVANKKADKLMGFIEEHLRLCGNEATFEQVEILSKNITSMNQRIYDAYKNTREFVDFIKKALPDAKINFVSKELAEIGFTPSVFSLDLPTKGKTDEEKEAYKRELNYKLINLMIERIPVESKHCVSYGQLKGSYWTIPATSTQGTTKEGDKDYIVRVALSPDMDVELHKKVFLDFVKGL